MLAWWLIIWSCFVVWLLNVLSRCRYVRSHVICVHFICSIKWKTSPRNVRFILMSSTEFGIYFLLNFLFFDLTALTQTNIPVSVHNFNWCNCRSICFLHSILTSDSYFWPDLFLSLFFSKCTKDPLNHRFFFTSTKIHNHPTNWSLLCARFFFFLILPVVCAPMVILMFVFIYSWFCCLCDKDGSTNRFEFLLKWYTSLQYFSLVRIHHALWFIAWNCFVQLTYSLICYYYYLSFFQRVMMIARSSSSNQQPAGSKSIKNSTAHSDSIFITVFCSVSILIFSSWSRKIDFVHSISGEK